MASVSGIFLSGWLFDPLRVVIQLIELGIEGANVRQCFILIPFLLDQLLSDFGRRQARIQLRLLNVGSV